MKAQDHGPPQPPALRRSMSFGVGQIIGIPLLLALPVLALFGVFGVEKGRVAAVAPGLEAQVVYPARFRYKTTHPFEISVRNTGAEPLSRVTVSIDRGYLSAFSEVQLTPQAEEITDRAYVIELRDIPPGGQRYVEGSVRADRYGGHEGAVAVATDAGVRAEAKVETVVFP